MSRRFLLLLVVLVTGAALRTAALPLPGTIDVQDWKIWAFAASTDMSSMYGVGGDPPARRLMHWQDVSTTTDYPPIALEQLKLVGKAYAALRPDFADSPLLNTFVKAPGVLAESLLVVVLLTWGRRSFGPDVALWAAAAVWLNPAMILDGAVLGYLDAQMAVPAVLAVLAAGVGAWALAGALLAVAVLTKVQAVVIVPVVVAAVLGHSGGSGGRRWRALLEFGVAGGAVAVAAVLPFVARGAMDNMVNAVGSLARQNMISGNGLNVWWVMTWIVRAIDSLDLGWWRAFTLEVNILQISDWVRLFPNPRLPAAALVVASLAWAAWRARRQTSLSALALLAGWSAYAYMMFNIPVHENHLYLAVPLFAAAAAIDGRVRPVFYAVTAMLAINLYVFYGMGEGRPPVIDRSWTVVDMTVLLSLLDVVLFAWTTRMVARHTRAIESEARAIRKVT